ncbi:MAG: hypothetical protein P8M32_01105 [Phycisphaerales bacterium]|nr:hypothetical protein [Phycisphaerales bacterium]
MAELPVAEWLVCARSIGGLDSGETTGVPNRRTICEAWRNRCLVAIARQRLSIRRFWPSERMDIELVNLTAMSFGAVDAY